MPAEIVKQKYYSTRVFAYLAKKKTLPNWLLNIRELVKTQNDKNATATEIIIVYWNLCKCCTRLLIFVFVVFMEARPAAFKVSFKRTASSFSQCGRKISEILIDLPHSSMPSTFRWATMSYG